MFQNVRPLSLSSIYKEARAALEIADIIFNAPRFARVVHWTTATSHSALETWLNWQKHFPAKEGPG